MTNRAIGRLRWVPRMSSLGLLVGVVLLIVGGCRPAPASPTPRATEIPTPIPSPSPATGSISGRLWQDQCRLSSDIGTPAAPPRDCTAGPEGEYRANGSRDSDEAGLGGVLVDLGAGECPASGLASAPARMDGTYSFTGLEPGTYCVSANASATANTGLLPGRWSFPSVDGPEAGQTVRLREGQTLVEVDFGWERLLAPTAVTATPSPTPTETAATPTPRPTRTPEPEVCYDQAAFVQDVSIPDNTNILPGQAFRKTWRLRNAGTCTWTTRYSVIFASGSKLGGPDSVPLPQAVPPGRTVDLSVDLVAPATPGTYEGRWLLRNENGKSFGIGSGVNRTFWVRIITGPTPTPVVSTWRGEYYTNRGLAGDPTVVRQDAAVSFKWSTGAPAAGLPTDNFSVRWTRRSPFEAGTYRFHVFADDGVRVWLDGVLIIDEWHEAANRSYAVERTLTAGQHDLRIEYYEREGAAEISFWSERVDAFLQWRGAYFGTPDLTGAALIVRNDPAIDFNWGSGTPVSGAPADNFSVRWTRTLAFEAGTFRFDITVDDGVRMWIDDQLVVDGWTGTGLRQLRADQALSAGYHTVRVEYNERTGDALIRLTWERLDYADWRGQYWANPSLSGSPVLVRSDPNVDFNWDSGSPAAQVPSDEFSARWTRDVGFDGGTYRFHILVDDGARLWVDGQKLLDTWRDGGARELTAEAALAQGKHSLRLEYYERFGKAQVRLWWEKVASPSFPGWEARYWPNKKLSGDPALVRNDKVIDFRWGTGSPAAGLPADSFSARWRRQVAFDPGVYRFKARADDGIRFFLDGELLIDEWHESSGQQAYQVEVELTGTHSLVVEYYEDAGDSLVKFSWERI